MAQRSTRMQFPPSPPPSRTRSAVRGRSAARASHADRYLSGALLAGALACGGTEAEPTPAEPVGCATIADCGEHQFCQANVCLERLSLPGISAGPDACAVMSCPDAEPDCCSRAVASATGNMHQSYSSQLHMLQHVDSEGGDVRAEFHFDAPNQQGWVTFELSDQLELSRLEITARRTGGSDHFLSVNTNQFDTGGCAIAFELEDRAESEGSSSSQLGFAEVELADSEFCYRGGLPGRASELAFAIFSTEPGPAALVISNVTLTLK